MVQRGSSNSVQHVALAMFARIFTLALFAQPRSALPFLHTRLRDSQRRESQQFGAIAVIFTDIGNTCACKSMRVSAMESRKCKALR